jgi:hypothetical protein
LNVECFVRFEDFVRRTSAGTEQSGFWALQQIGVADDGNRLTVQLDGLDWIHDPSF